MGLLSYVWNGINPTKEKVDGRMSVANMINGLVWICFGIGLIFLQEFHLLEIANLTVLIFVCCSTATILFGLDNA